MAASWLAQLTETRMILEIKESASSRIGIREDVDSLISKSVCVSGLCANQEAAREAREKQGDQGAARKQPVKQGAAGIHSTRAQPGWFFGSSAAGHSLGIKPRARRVFTNLGIP